MKKPASIGHMEQLVLTAILGLRDDAYGVSIHQRVSELSDPRRVSLGSVYVALDRLEDKGMVKSHLADPTPERGGRSKRCYSVEALGERVLQESATIAKRIWDSIVQAWGEDWVRGFGAIQGKGRGPSKGKPARI